MDFGRDEVVLQIELPHKGREDFAVCGLHDPAEEVVLFTEQAALADFEDAATGFVVVAGHAEDVAVNRLVEDDFLAGAHGF